MKRILSCILLLCLCHPSLAEQPIELDKLSIAQLKVLRQAADRRIQQLSLPDADGYVPVHDGQDYLRSPRQHIDERILLEGRVFSMHRRGDGLEYFLSLDHHPQQIFLLRQNLPSDEGDQALLPGDAVTAWGIFRGQHPYGEDDPLASGSGLVDIDQIVRRDEQAPPLAAAPYAGTREDPVPLGITASYEGSYWSGYASYEMRLLSASRGNTALKAAQKMSKYNITPPRNQEWYIVTLWVKALSAPGDRAEIQQEDFYFVSQSGTEYRHHFLINDTQVLRSLYEGGEQTANIACLIDKGDEPLLVYQAESLHPLWFDPGREALEGEGT